MDYKQIAYYCIQIIRYGSMFCGPGLATIGFIKGDYSDIMIGCGGFLAHFSLTPENTKNELGIRNDSKTLDDKLE